MILRWFFARLAFILTNFAYRTPASGRQISSNSTVYQRARLLRPKQESCFSLLLEGVRDLLDNF